MLERNRTKRCTQAAEYAFSQWNDHRGGWVIASVRRLKMHPHEESLIHSFVLAERRPRWLQCLDSSKKRSRMLDRLNHCRDLDPRFAHAIPSNANVYELLISRKAPQVCYVLSDNEEIDGREMKLSDAIEQAKVGGWGTLIGCIPNRLAYYYDECGERQMILERDG